MTNRKTKATATTNMSETKATATTNMNETKATATTNISETKATATTNILFCGIGGQGILKAAEVCGWAAINNGYHVKKSEVHGMAQRGGSVESHLRFGKEVFSPLIPEGRADYLVPFYPDEEIRLKHFLKQGGTDLLPYIEKATAAVDNPRYVNTFLLGVLSNYLPLSEKSWHDALARVFKAKTVDQNIKVFSEGRECKL